MLRSPKKREIQEREQQILQVARRLLLELGYLQFNMERVAEAIHCAKGTVYQHFKSKEDLLAALCSQTKRKRLDLMRQVDGFVGNPRERMTAILLSDEIFVQRYKDFSRTEELLYIEVIAEKASDKRRKELRDTEEACLACLNPIMQDAVESGDMVLPPHLSIFDLVFGFWALSLGTRSAEKSCDTLSELVKGNVVGQLRMHQQALMDGWGWKPLSKEWDYDATRRRAAVEAFNDADFIV